MLALIGACRRGPEEAHGSLTRWAEVGFEASFLSDLLLLQPLPGPAVLGGDNGSWIRSS